MKTSKTRLAVLLVSTLVSFSTAYAQFTPSADAYTLTSSPAANFGSKNTLLVESAGATTFIRLDLSSIPPSVTGSMVAKGTLKIYVSTVPTAGSFNVDLVTSSWTESSITANNSPTLGSAIASAVPVTTSDKNQYVLVDVTAAVVDWLNGTANDGLALVPDGTVSFALNSKETTTTSHSAELDIVFTGSGGSGITGITTASGSGLIGGGTSGTLNLSLTNACAANQILQWSGSAWICAAAGTGTVTSVGSGTGLTGGPITGSGTLSIDSTRVPLLSVENNFTASQNVNGSISATSLIAAGSVTGATVTGTTVNGATVNATTGFSIGGTLFAFGFNGNSSFLGFAGNPANTLSAYNTATGYLALANDTSVDGTDFGDQNTAIGAFALQKNTQGFSNTAVGAFALNSNTAGGGSNGAGNTAIGQQALGSNTTGATNSAVGFNALQNNVAGSNNTAVGFAAGPDVNSSNLSNSSAIGANAVVSESNALVLGGTGANAVKVGIGTAVPAYVLEVDSVGANAAQMAMVSTGTDAAIAVKNTASGGREYWIDSGSGGAGVGAGNFAVYDHTASATRLVVNQSGDVGIGTTSPTNRLTIVQGGGAALADGWNTYSSRRWKTNIQPLQNALGKVEQLRGVSYDLKESGKHEIGVIAEEVGTVVPEVVSYEENGKDARGVDYSRLTALLIEATKQQQREFRQEQTELAKAMQQIRQQQSLLRAQSAALRSLKAEVLETRESLRKVKAQIGASQLTVVAAK